MEKERGDEGCSDFDKYQPYIDVARRLFVSSLNNRIYDGLAAFVYNQDRNFGSNCLEPSSHVSSLDKWLDVISGLQEPFDPISHGTEHQDIGFFERVLKLTVKYLIKEGVIACFLNAVVLNNRLNGICRELETLGMNGNFLKYWRLSGCLENNNNNNYGDALTEQETRDNVEYSSDGVDSEITFSRLKNKETSYDENSKQQSNSRKKTVQLAENFARNSSVKDGKIDGRKSTSSKSSLISNAISRSSRAISDSIPSQHTSGNENWTKENLKIHICQAGCCSVEKISLPIKPEGFIQQLIESGSSIAGISCLEKLKRNFKICLKNICLSVNNILRNFDRKIIRRCCLFCRVQGDYLKVRLKRQNPDGCKIDLLSDLIVIHQAKCLESHHSIKMEELTDNEQDSSDFVEEIGEKNPEGIGDPIFSSTLADEGDSDDNSSFKSAKSFTKKSENLIHHEELKYVTDDTLLREKLFQLLQSISQEKYERSGNCGDCRRSICVQTSFKSPRGSGDCPSTELELKIFKILQSIMLKNDSTEREKSSGKETSLVILHSPKSLPRIDSSKINHSSLSISLDIVSKNLKETEPIEITEPRSPNRQLDSPDQIKFELNRHSEIFNDEKSSLIFILDPKSQSSRTVKSNNNDKVTLTPRRIKPENKDQLIKASSSFFAPRDSPIDSIPPSKLANKCPHTQQPKSKIQSSCSCHPRSSDEKIIDFSIEIQRIKSIITSFFQNFRHKFSPRVLKKLRRIIRKKILCPLLLERERSVNTSKVEVYERRISRNFSESIESSVRHLPRKPFCMNASENHRKYHRSSHDNRNKLNDHRREKNSKKSKYKKENKCTCCNNRTRLSTIYYRRGECITSSVTSVTSAEKIHINTKIFPPSSRDSHAEAKIKYKFFCPHNDEKCPAIIDTSFRSILTQYVNLCKSVKYSLLKSQPDSINQPR